jgi:hypothetical protein
MGCPGANNPGLKNQLSANTPIRINTASTTQMPFEIDRSDSDWMLMRVSMGRVGLDTSRKTGQPE